MFIDGPEKGHWFPITMKDIVDGYNNTGHDDQAYANEQHGIGKYYARG
jgi:hypothetical protein